MPIKIKILLIIAVSAVISACSSSPTKLPEPAEPLVIETPSYTPEELIVAARNSLDNDQKITYLLKAAELYWINNRKALAKATLTEIDTAVLRGVELRQYVLFQLQIGIDESDTDILESTLALTSPYLFAQSDIETQRKAGELTARAQLELGQTVEAAVTLAENTGFYDGDEFWQVNEDIWQILSSSETNQIAQFEYSGDNYDVRGWLSLATNIKQNEINLEQQYEALQFWLEQWEAHPASLQLPRELQILSTLPEKRPRVITLALPFSGALKEVGNAIRDGFLAAYYQSTEASKFDVDIRFFDTDKNLIDELYSNPKYQSDLIIGPLDKPSLSTISRFDSINIPTLALNYLEDDTQIETLYQFGLAPEIEASQVANELAALDLERIAVIAPDNDWGYRMADTFTNQLIENGKRVIQTNYYGDQKSLSDNVAQLLATKDSNSRARNLRGITGLKLEFVPRRRNDIDAIFMVAKPEIARQLKPLFAFHYAGRLPVFSTSHIHNSYAEKTENQDLNKIYFTEIPWILSRTNPIKVSIKNNSPEQSRKYDRFYALGADAFNLAPRIELLKEISNSRVDGFTGFLSMDKNGRIKRELEWARFDGGTASAVKINKQRI